MTVGQSNTLKLLGIFLMVIDHIGAYLVPVPFFRILGRLVFPIFAYQLSVGYDKTSNKSKYLNNLIIFSFVSQVPYYLLGNVQLNIIATLAVGFCVLWLLDNNYYLTSIFAFLVGSVVCAYGAYGIALILLFRYYRSDPALLSFLFIFINVWFWVFYGSVVQFYSLFALVPIFLLRLPELSINKYFFYVFYPLHLLIIYFISLYV